MNTFLPTLNGNIQCKHSGVPAASECCLGFARKLYSFQSKCFHTKLRSLCNCVKKQNFDRGARQKVSSPRNFFYRTGITCLYGISIECWCWSSLGKNLLGVYSFRNVYFRCQSTIVTPSTISMFVQPACRRSSSPLVSRRWNACMQATCLFYLTILPACKYVLVISNRVIHTSDTVNIVEVSRLTFVNYEGSQPQELQIFQVVKKIK